MDKNKSINGRKCFIITPIGDQSSEIFRMAKGVIESVIKPLLEQYEYYDIKPAYEINKTGMISTQIINRILEDDLVIANLTGNNPNVMYELCLRHVTAKPIIHICQFGTNLPFDIKDSRTIFYKDDMLGVQELMKQIDEFMKELDYTKDYIDNPIYNAKRIGNLLKDVPVEGEKGIEIELLQNILNVVSGENQLDLHYNIKNDDDRFDMEHREYVLDIDELISEDKRNTIIQELQEELFRRNIRITRIDNARLFCKNIGNTKIKRVKEIVNTISAKYETKILLNYS